MTAAQVHQHASDGLTAAEVAALRARHGPNILPEPRRRPVWHRVLAALRDPLVMVLLAAMAVTAALGDHADLAVIAMVVVLNTSVGVAQELRAEQAVAALRRLSAPRARVVRDGTQRVVPAAELVPGDRVLLEAGDVVPADLALDEAVRVAVDEAALTGESVPTPKEPGSEVAAGTVLATGRAAGRVVRTGTDSTLGRIAALVDAQPLRPTPLQRRLAGLGRMLAVAAAALSAVVLLSGLIRGQPPGQVVLSAVSLTVAAVPESLPAVVTVALALGARRMARRRAIVRRLPAVETLGSVTVVASDKTGTLTEGVMSVERLVGPDGTVVRLRGRGYEPRGTVDPDPLPVPLHRLVTAVLLCNDADLSAPDHHDHGHGHGHDHGHGHVHGDGHHRGRGQWSPVGDPTEAALVAAAARCGVDTRVRETHRRLAEVPFDAVRRHMVTLHAVPSGGYVVAAKGAPEAMLAPAGPVAMTSEERDRAMAAAGALAAEGYRVLAVADRQTASHPDLGGELALRFAGLVALVDPIRAQAREAVGRFADAGVGVVLITGDHPATAAAVAARLGIAADAVHARVRPERKLDIIADLQAAGEVVAMTGDGVNDAPALRRADIGVAMGLGGTEAARQAADLVLADDNLATVGAAIEEGRRIYTNIRRFLAYALSGGVAEILVMLAGPWLGLAVPLLPAQILWINMLTHGLPGVAFGAEPPDGRAMRGPPRRPDEAILGGGLARQIGLTGAAIAGTALGAALVADATGRAWQPVLFTVLGMAQLWTALALRTRSAGRGGHRWLGAAVATSAVLQLAALWFAPLRSLLGTSPLSIPEAIGCVIVAALPAGLLARAARRPR